VSAVLILADSIRSPEMRHEVPVPVPDPFLYVEQNGTRTVICSAFEMQRIKEKAPDVETLSPEAFGIDELLRGGMQADEAMLEVHTRACSRFGITSARVPPTFPLELADHLRANGIDVSVDREYFDDRRRRKTDVEIEGLRRAQTACERALDVSRELLRNAQPAHGILTLDGEPLTVERIKREVERVFSEHGVVGEEFIVSHGAQTAVGHEMGSGTIAPNEPIVFDLFPRDRETGVYSDMTRTYVVGEISDEIREFHRLCKQVLDETTAATRPGANGKELMRMCCDVFDAHGYPTPLHKAPGEVLDSGFFHSLGHGVGIEIHEEPGLGLAGREELVPGDVVTVEPGCYRPGYGGVRLEDLILVTEDGCENLTQFPYGLDP
jgi:Xaa-Pro aminopeptidase